MSKAPRNGCFTINNPTTEDYNNLTNNGETWAQYLVFGLEHGENGTPHIQGYYESKDQHRFVKMKSFLGPRAHFEKRKGLPKEAAGYCKKGECANHITESEQTFPPDMTKRCVYCLDYPGTPKKRQWDWFFPRTMDDPETWLDAFEIGTISTQGKRTDIDAPVEMITEGHTLREVAATFPAQYVKYHKGFRDLMSVLALPRSLSQPPEVIVLWGGAETGKTRDAYLKYYPEIPYYLWKPSNGNWFDGYDGQEKMIIDEFRGTMPWADLLGLLDRNEFRAQYKGGFVQIQTRIFIITSPLPPTLWYKTDERYDRYKQLERRITRVVHHGTLEPFVVAV